MIHHTRSESQPRSADCDVELELELERELERERSYRYGVYQRVGFFGWGFNCAQSHPIIVILYMDLEFCLNEYHWVRQTLVLGL